MLNAYVNISCYSCNQSIQSILFGPELLSSRFFSMKPENCFCETGFCENGFCETRGHHSFEVTELLQKLLLGEFLGRGPLEMITNKELSSYGEKIHLSLRPVLLHCAVGGNRNSSRRQFSLF
jgi:hypothetical protein